MSLDKLWIIPHIYHSRNSPFPISSFSHCWLNSNSYLWAPLSFSQTPHFCYSIHVSFHKKLCSLKRQIISLPLCSKCCHGFPSDWKVKFKFSTKILLFQEHPTHPCLRSFELLLALAFSVLFSDLPRSSSFQVSAQMLPDQSILLWPVYITQSSSIKFNTIFYHFY